MATLPEERVIHMVRAGTITREEGDRLIEALHPGPARWKLLISPFEQLSTRGLWILAFGVTVAGLAAARLGVRFDGALDLHPLTEQTPWPFVALDVASSILITSVVFWLASLVAARQGRIGDFVLSVAAARLPNVLMGVLALWLLPPPEKVLADATAGIVDFKLIAVSLFILMPGLVWFIAMLCSAFKTSSGLKGVRLGIAFAVALIASEIVSKVFLYFLASQI